MACGEEWRRPLSEYSDDDNPWPRNADAELDIDPRNASFTEFFFGVFTEFFFVHSVRNRSTSTVSPRLRPILETDPRFFFVVSWYQVTFNSNRFQFWLLRLGHSTELTFTEFFFTRPPGSIPFVQSRHCPLERDFVSFSFGTQTNPPSKKIIKLTSFAQKRRDVIDWNAARAAPETMPLHDVHLIANDEDVHLATSTVTTTAASLASSKRRDSFEADAEVDSGFSKSNSPTDSSAPHGSVRYFTTSSSLEINTIP